MCHQHWTLSKSCRHYSNLNKEAQRLQEEPAVPCWHLSGPTKPWKTTVEYPWGQTACEAQFLPIFYPEKFQVSRKVEEVSQPTPVPWPAVSGSGSLHVVCLVFTSTQPSILSSNPSCFFAAFQHEVMSHSVLKPPISSTLPAMARGSSLNTQRCPPPYEYCPCFPNTSSKCSPLLFFWALAAHHTRIRLLREL